MPSRGEKYTEKKRRRTDHRKVLPLLASDARVLPSWGSTICVPALLVSGYLPSSTLHRRLWSGCKRRQHRAPESLNRNPFYLTYVVLCVFARVCAYARLSCSLSFASLTRCTVHLCFNRNSFYLTYFVLSVFVRVCVYAWLSYSLSFARLTCSPVVSRPSRSPDSSLLAFLVPWFETPVVLPDFYASARITSTSLVNPRSF